MGNFAKTQILGRKLGELELQVHRTGQVPWNSDTSINNSTKEGFHRKKILCFLSKIYAGKSE